MQIQKATTTHQSLLKPSEEFTRISGLEMDIMAKEKKNKRLKMLKLSFLLREKLVDLEKNRKMIFQKNMKNLSKNFQRE